MPWQGNGGGGGPWGSGPSGGGGGQGGGSGPGGGGPWGRGPGGGGGFEPPNLDDLLRRGQDHLRRVGPGGLGGGRMLGLLGALAIGAWALTGFYRVDAGQIGVVQRFGEYVRTVGPGLNYVLPGPVETLTKVDVAKESQLEVTRGSAATRRGQAAPAGFERQMLTGDENLVEVDFTLRWKVRDGQAPDFLFKIRDPEALIRITAESVLRDLVGQRPIQQVLTESRSQIETDARQRIQTLLDEYKAGIEIRVVQLQNVVPPQQVVEAFDDVQNARNNRERLRNDAEAYRNELLPRARGDSERLLQEAQAYREEVINRANGDASRFNQVLSAYRAAPAVTTQRLYLETMEQVLQSTNKVILDRPGDGGGAGVLPYLPLPALRNQPAAPAQQQVRPQ